MNGRDMYSSINIDVDCSLNDPVGRTALTPDQEERFIAATYLKAIPRFLDVLDQHGCKATFFLVAKTAKDPGIAALIRRLHSNGHEIASHTFSHPKDLAHLPSARMREELYQSKSILEDVIADQVLGFRGPGYAHNNRILHLLVETGYKYSSSTNPAIFYAVTKSLFAIANFGRPRREVYRANYRFLLSPRMPYYPDLSCFWRRGNQRELLEVPISTDSFRLFPSNVWSAMVMLPGWAQSLLWKNILHRQRFANIEFHDLEFCEANDFMWQGRLPNSTALILKVPFAKRLESIAQLIRDAGSNRRYILLRDLAKELDGRSAASNRVSDTRGRPSCG